MQLKRSRIVLIVHALVILWLGAAVYACLSIEPSSGFSAICPLFTCATLWFLASWLWIGGHVLDPYFLFLLAALTFNGGQLWLRTLDASARIARNELTPSELLKAAVLIILSVAFLHLGAICAIIRNKPPDSPSSSAGAGPAKAIGWLLLGISIGPAIFVNINAISVIAQYGYFAGIFQQERPVGTEVAPILIARLLIPAAFLLYASSGKARWLKLLATSLMVFYVITNFFLGVRSAAVMCIVGYVWLKEHAPTRISRPLLIIAGCALLVILPALALIRDVPGSERLSIANLSSMLSALDNPPAALLNETGDTIATVAYTIKLVPDLIPYDLGFSYCYGTLTVLPNLFGGELHPSFAHGFPGMWISRIIAPQMTALGGALGYSFIAEAYMNFGWVGIPLVMTALGFSIQKLAQWASNAPSPQKLSFVASAIGILIFFARGESFGIVRPLVWYALFPYLLVEGWSKVQRYRLAIARNRDDGARHYANTEANAT